MRSWWIGPALLVAVSLAGCDRGGGAQAAQGVPPTPVTLAPVALRMARQMGAIGLP